MIFVILGIAMPFVVCLERLTQRITNHFARPNLNEFGFYGPNAKVRAEWARITHDRVYGMWEERKIARAHQEMLDRLAAETASPQIATDER